MQADIVSQARRVFRFFAGCMDDLEVEQYLFKKIKASQAWRKRRGVISPLINHSVERLDMPSFRLVKRILSCLILASCLTACQWTTEPSTTHDYYTRVTELSSKSFYFTNNPLIQLEMQAKWISNQGYVIDTIATSTNSNDLDISLAWSQKRNYRYVAREKLNIVCTLGCTMSEKGRIFIPEDEFRQYAVSGFIFKLVGRGNYVDGFLDKRAFQQVLDQMQSMPKY